MKRTKPDLLVNHRYLPQPKVVCCIGELVPGQLAQVMITDDVQRTNLEDALRDAYPHTRFTIEGFRSGGKAYIYIYIEKLKNKTA